MPVRYDATLARPLIDDETWSPVLDAIRAARRSIDLTQLLFEPAFRPRGRAVADELEAAARRGVRVRILVNQNAAVPDSYDELRERFAGTPVEVHALSMTPNVLHAKILLADDAAFLLDAPFEQKYVDTRSHPFDSARRRHAQPFHSVSLGLAGRPLVTRLRSLFDALWEGEAALVGPPASPSPSSPLQLAWTSPVGYWSATQSEGILDAYTRAFRSARRFVYVETQYLTSPRIVRLLAEALDREPALEVILVLNEHMDVPTYDAWQARRLAELDVPEHPRLGAFSLWSPRRVAADPMARPVYVHSKIAIVDDAWATLGSANLDSLSLHDADEFGFVAPPNIELNAVIHDAAFAATLRRRLWGEHLGDAGVWRVGEPPEGWLARWRAVAEANVARLRAGDPRFVGRVMPLQMAQGAMRGRERMSRHGPDARA